MMSACTVVKVSTIVFMRRCIVYLLFTRLSILIMKFTHCIEFSFYFYKLLTWVCTISEEGGLISIMHVILHVCQLVVRRQEVSKRGVCAHLQSRDQ